jgi:tetratricopeptide (TPR) repeat protein
LLILRGDCYFELGDYDDAVDDYEDALDIVVPKNKKKYATPPSNIMKKYQGNRKFNKSPQPFCSSKPSASAEATQQKCWRR